MDREVGKLATRRDLSRLEVRHGGEVLASKVSGDPVADVAVRVRKSNGRQFVLVVSTTRAARFAAESRGTTGVPLVLSVDGRLAATPGIDPGELSLAGEIPRTQDADLPSDEYRVRIVGLPDAVGEIRVALLGPAGSVGLSSGQALIGALLVALVLLALALIVPLLRDLDRLHERAAEEAVTDELTGLANHRRFKELIAHEVERSKRFEHPLSLLMIDIDDFKEVNDTYGHLQGDHVLRAVAHLMAGESREVDEPARYGGEEFALVLPETDSHSALEVAQRIRTRLQSTRIPLSGRDGEITVKVSVGVAGTPDTALDPTGLVEAADEALYRAKREGKNRVARATAIGAPDPATA